MKRIIIICLLSCLSYTGVAQDSFPFPDSNAVWSYYYQYGHDPGPPMNWDYLTRHYALFNNDTVINDTLYRKIYSTTDSIFPEDLNSLGYDLIRKENEKVYYLTDYDFNGTLEKYIIYDFNLNVEDTLHIKFFGGYSSYLVCQEIDSILLDGKYRKRWLITCPETSFYNYWIEGIGSDYHLLSTLEPYFSVDFDFWELLCFEQENNLIYENINNPDYDSNCHTEGHFPPDIIEEITKGNAQIVVSPNPVRNVSVVRMQNISSEQAKIYIYNSTGQLIKKYLKNEKIINLYNKDYRKGIYFIKAIIDSKIFTTKFIIN